MTEEFLEREEKKRFKQIKMWLKLLHSGIFL